MLFFFRVDGMSLSQCQRHKGLQFGEARVHCDWGEIEKLASALHVVLSSLQVPYLSLFAKKQFDMIRQILFSWNSLL